MNFLRIVVVVVVVVVVLIQNFRRDLINDPLLYYQKTLHIHPLTCSVLLFCVEKKIP